MKKLLVITLIFFNFSVARSYTLVQAQRTPGFIALPRQKVFILDSSGLMTLRVASSSNHKTRIENLGRLSSYVLNQIKNEITNISLATPLIDKQAGDPICADAPGLNISIYKNEVSDVIYRKEECHEWRLQNYEGQVIIGIALALIEF